jgi:Amt family ammonium transporter
MLFLQSGFALLEAGTVRTKNVRNILLKNVIDACIAAFCWWGVGSAFAQGQTNGCGNAFIGDQNFFGSGISSQGPAGFAIWIFGFAFSATASTIVSGAVAERVQFRSYLIYTVFITAFVYPVVAHWVWSSSGWLSAWRVSCGTENPLPTFTNTNGLLDFAGSGVVHMVGGAAGLAGSIIAGPRLGRFVNGHIVHFENTNASQMTLGTLILWLGWYGFNAGSTGCVYGCMGTAAIAAANTTISTAAGGLTCLFINVVLGKPGDVGPLLNGILAGAVSVTASCAYVEPYAAFIIGMVGAGVYQGASALLMRLQIDDPLDAAPVHFFCGVWGVLASGFFAVESKVIATYGYAEGWGLFYGGGGKQFGVQILGIVTISAWSGLLASICFYLLKRFGCLRVSKEDEFQGLDITGGIGSGSLLGCLGRMAPVKD